MDKCAYLLLENPQDARDLSQAVRNLGPVSYYFSTLDQFWKALDQGRPYLAIIDVVKMSESHLLLKHHPLVANGQVPIIFFYDPQHRPLLESTQEIFHYGLVGRWTAGDPSYETALRNILKRVQLSSVLAQDLIGLKDQLVKAEREKQHLAHTLDDLRVRERYEGNLAILLDKLENGDFRGGDFLTLVSKFMESWEVVLKFSFMCLSEDGSKICSPPVKASKHLPLPPLATDLGENPGIPFYVQNMATSLAMDSDKLGEDCLPLLIYGTKEFPEILLYVKVAPLELDKINWRLFEKILTGLHCRYLLEVRENFHSSEKHITSWCLFSDIDRVERKSSQYLLYQLQFKGLSSWLQRGAEGRFYYRQFIEGLEQHLAPLLPTGGKYCHWGVHSLLIYLDEEALSGWNQNSFEKEMRETMAQFPLWKFFETSKDALRQKFSLSLRPLQGGVEVIFRELSKGFGDLLMSNTRSYQNSSPYSSLNAGSVDL